MKRLMYLLLGAAALTACTKRQTTQTKTDEGVLTKTAAAETAETAEAPKKTVCPRKSCKKFSATPIITQRQTFMYIQVSTN